MKPTQQEIIELARQFASRYTNRHYPDKPVFTFTQDALQKVIELALESFGAGGGEPVGYVRPEVIDLLGRGVRCGSERLSPRADEEDGLTAPLYTHPLHTDLRAEYLRGLDDAAGICDRFQHRGVGMQPAECASAIRAMKGKQ